MKPRLFKAGVIFLEIFGALVAVSVILFGYALWRIEHKGLSLNGFRSVAAHSINKKLPEGYSVTLDQIYVRVVPEDRALYQVEMRDILLVHNQDEIATSITSSLPVILIEIPKGQLLKGEFGVRTLTANNISIDVHQQTLQNKTPASSPQRSPLQESIAQSFSRLLQNPAYNDTLRNITMNDMRVLYKGPQENQNWQAERVNIKFEKPQGTDFTLKARADILYVNQKSDMVFEAAYDEEKDSARILLDGHDMPLGDISALFFGLPASPLTAPISGKSTFEITSDGTLLDVDFDLEAGAGNLLVTAFGSDGLGSDALPVNTLKANGGYDPQLRALKLEQLDFSIGESRGFFSGLIKLENTQTQNAKSTDNTPAFIFDLKGRDIALNAEEVFQELLVLDSVTAIGKYDVHGRNLSFDTIKLRSDDVTVGGDLLLHIPPKDENVKNPPFGLKADLKVEGRVGYQKVMAFWPIKLAPISQGWIRSRVRGGYAQNITFKADLKPGLRGELGYTPNEDLRLEFDVRDVSVDYIYGLPLLTGGTGHGVLQGNTLKVMMHNGRIDNVKINKGSVHFPKFNPQTENTIIQFDAQGEAGEILDILNQKPLTLISRGGLDPKQISGDAVVSVEIERVRPVNRTANNNRNGFNYNGSATFENLTFKEIYGNVDLENAQGTIDLKTRKMVIAGIAEVDRVPVNIEWLQNFNVEDGPSQLSVKGKFDSSTADLIGLPVRSYLRGAIDYSVHAQGAYRALKNVRIEADLSEAALRFDLFGWTKNKNIPAKAKVDIEFAEAGGADATKVNSFILKGDTLDIDGQLSFSPTGKLLGLGFKKFYIKDQADFAAEAERSEEGELDFILSGAFLDMGPVITNFLVGRAPQNERESTIEISNDSPTDNDVESDNKSAIDWGEGVRASLRIDKLGLRNEIVINDASLDIWRDSKKLQILNLAGIDDDLDPLSITLSHGNGFEGNNESIIEAQSADLGTLLEALFEVTSVKNGEGILHLYYSDVQKNIITGDVYAQNVRLVNAPILAKLFAAGSFDGLGDLMNNEGIVFDKIKTDFQIDNNRVSFDAAQAVGPSIGITANGSLGLNGGGNVDLNGAIAPLYQVNSLLGNVPLIGDLLVNRNGEGVLALSYKVSGDVAAPSISINPLSALTPGVFRRVFEPVAERAPELVNKDTSSQDKEFIPKKRQEEKQQN